MRGAGLLLELCAAATLRMRGKLLLRLAVYYKSGPAARGTVPGKLACSRPNENSAVFMSHVFWTRFSEKSRFWKRLSLILIFIVE